ncbi:MAG: HAMP domain-containing histidine kinase [Bacteroides sp.]|nr:HAMP domain-containing histidine kinase [Bacteroides sp.]
MTPLTIISASLDELKNQFPSFNELYKTMDLNVQRLIRLLQQILEFRKAESGNLQLRVAKGNIALFIRHKVESFEPLIRKLQLHFSVVCEQEIMEAYFDRDKLDKILYNLLSNAAKYNRKEGYIQLSVKYSRSGKSVLISIKDNGKGISKERQETLFQRFYEGDYRQSHTIGTGIGLSLTRDLVNLHHGTIRLESEVEKGARFL